MTNSELVIRCVLEMYEAENVEAIAAIRTICEQYEDKLERKLAEDKGV